MTSRARAMKVAAAPVHGGCDVIGCRLHKTQEEASTIEIVHNSFGTTACSMEQQAEADCKTNATFRERADTPVRCKVPGAN